MDTVRIERTKLLASALDRVSTVCITVGIATPLSAFVFGSNVLGNVLVAACYLWLLAAAGFHLAAQFVLGKLDT